MFNMISIFSNSIYFDIKSFFKIIDIWDLMDYILGIYIIGLSLYMIAKPIIDFLHSHYNRDNDKE